MTRVYCTKKLQDFVVEVEETLTEDYNDIKLTDWYAHLFMVNGRKCIIFVNILTYYCIFIEGIVKKDIKNMDNLFVNRLKEQLNYDWVTKNINDPNPFIDGAKINFIKTSNNKKAIGRINDFVQTFKIHCSLKYGHIDIMDIIYENKLINEVPTGYYTETKKCWTSPVANVKKIMETGV
jgi:hypothetical protein